jgi:hypothetical protein
MLDQVNYAAVALAAAAAFVFGAVYYMALSWAWLEALGKTHAQHRAEGGSPGPFLVSAVGETIMALVLWAVMSAAGVMTVAGGMLTGMLVWLGFVVTTISINYAYQRRRPSLSVIDGVHWLGALLLMGGVIGAFGN